MRYALLLRVLLSWLSCRHLCFNLFFIITPLPPKSTLFPYTTLFRSRAHVSRHPRTQMTLSIGTTAPDFDVTSSDGRQDRKSTRLNSSHANISYAVFCLKKKKMYKMTKEENNS